MNNDLYTNKQEINIRKLLTLLVDNFKKICLSGIFTAIVFILFSYTQAPLYKSSISLFKINDSGFSLMSGSPIDNILGSDNQLNDRLKIDVKDLISSQGLAEKIVNKDWATLNGNNIIDYWELNDEGFLTRFLPKKDKDELYSIQIQEAAIKEFSTRLSVSENIKTGLVTVSLSMENRYLSVEILDYITTFIKDFTYKNIVGINNKEIEYLQQRINTVDNQIEQSADELIDFLENNKGYMDSPSLLIEYQYFQQNLSFKQSVMITLLQQMEIAKLNKVNIKPVVGVLDNPEVPGKKSSPSRKVYLLAGLILGIFAQSLKIIYLSTKDK
tara:strand:+ start:10738 stop:11721 length:984 start_codon:yes stop_codon:yes gene_type:complete